jgi:hypothetical protein
MSEQIRTYYIAHTNHYGDALNLEEIRAVSAADALIQWRSVVGPPPFQPYDFMVSRYCPYILYMGPEPPPEKLLHEIKACSPSKEGT